MLNMLIAARRSGKAKSPKSSWHGKMGFSALAILLVCISFLSGIAIAEHMQARPGNADTPIARNAGIPGAYPSTALATPLPSAKAASLWNKDWSSSLADEWVPDEVTVVVPPTCISETHLVSYFQGERLDFRFATPVTPQPVNVAAPQPLAPSEGLPLQCARTGHSG